MTPNRSASLGPKGGGVPVLKTEDVKFIAVHCSATPPSQNLGVADIDRMHRLRGFLKVGYHFVIKRDGTVEKGRELSERGAHVEDWNHCSVGICLIGGVDAKLRPEANFTPAQFASLQALLADLSHTFPTALIQGHRDFPKVAKACPSFNVKQWLQSGQVLP